MKRFSFAKLAKLGEMDEKYGQSYWGETNEQLEPVKFNSMNEDITAQDTIEAEEILLKTSAKGIDYHQLKKVKVVNPAFIPADTSVGSSGKTPQFVKDPIDVQLDRIEEKLDQLLDIQKEAKEDLSDVPDFLRPGDNDE